MKQWPAVRYGVRHKALTLSTGAVARHPVVSAAPYFAARVGNHATGEDSMAHAGYLKRTSLPLAEEA